METNNRKQLVTQDNGNIEKIFPKNYMSNIVDEETGESLRIFLLKYNHIDLGYRSSKSSARLAVPIIMRRKGLYITYYLPDDVVITEFFNGNKTEVSDTSWIKDELWCKNVNELNVYDVKISDGSITLDKLSEEVMQLISSKGDITINNFPDNEDLELYTIYQDSNNKIDVIRFKDRDNSNGMAYKYLRKTKNMILSQSDFNQANTIYEIRYDFDLNGSTISIPDNCELKFVGGSLNNGSINFNNTLLSGDIKTNTEILGNLKNNKIEVNWFNVDNTGNIDSTNIINKILEISSGKEVIFNGIYKVNPIASSSKEYDGGIRPISNQTLRFQENTKIIIDSQNTLYYSIISIYKVSNVNIIGAIVEGDINTHLTNKGEFGFGFAISSSKNINLYNCVSNNNWGDGYIFLSTGTEESNNFNCNLYNCEAHYNRRQGLSIVALYEGNIDNFKATNTGILKYTAPAAGIDIEPDAIRYDERIKVIINNYISENNFGGALHIVPAHLMHDNVTNDHREYYVQVNGLSSNSDGSRDTSVLLPVLRYSSVTTDSNLSNKIKGLVELNDITISNSYMNPLEFRNMVDNGLPIIINNLVVLNPKIDSSFAKSMSAVLKFYNPTTYDYTDSVKLTINNIKVTDTRVDNRVSYLIFSTFGNSPKNIHLFNVNNPSMEGGTNIPYFIDDSSEVEYNPLPVHVVDDDTNFLLANTSNNYWGYRIIFNNPSTKSFRLPKGSTVTNFKIIVENIQKDNVVHSRFIAGDKINEPLIYNTDPSLELIPYSSIKFIQEKDQSWSVYKSTDNIIPTLNPYYGINKNAIQEGSNLRLGHSYYDTKLNTTLNYGENGWENPDGTYIDKVSIISDITNIVSSNTIYKIVSDIDLGGTTLTLPANCTLDFQGGSFSNGTISLNSTELKGNIKLSFIILTGSCSNNIVELDWFTDTGDQSTNLQSLANVVRTQGIINIGIGKYLINNTVTITKALTLKGNSIKSYYNLNQNIYNSTLYTESDINIIIVDTGLVNIEGINFVGAATERDPDTNVRIGTKALVRISSPTNSTSNCSVSRCNFSTSHIGLEFERSGIDIVSENNFTMCNCGLRMFASGDSTIINNYFNTISSNEAFDDTNVTTLNGIGLLLSSSTGNTNVIGGKVEYCNKGIVVNSCMGVNINAVQFDWNKSGNLFFVTASYAITGTIMGSNVTGCRFLGTPAKQHIYIRYWNVSKVNICGNFFTKNASDIAAIDTSTGDNEGPNYIMTIVQKQTGEQYKQPININFKGNSIYRCTNLADIILMSTGTDRASLVNIITDDNTLPCTGGLRTVKNGMMDILSYSKTVSGIICNMKKSGNILVLRFAGTATEDVVNKIITPDTFSTAAYLGTLWQPGESNDYTNFIQVRETNGVLLSIKNGTKIDEQFTVVTTSLT